MSNDRLPQARFEARLDLLAAEPGVYLMKDAAGSVIYVGKARNLPRRLRSYFCAKPRGTAKVLAMISHIADFETVICRNELEALILENNLIKAHMPPYNILLRDDREYPYIRVTYQEAYPRVLKAFHVAGDQMEGARYFGPYQAGDLARALSALREIFPLKTCRRVFPRDIGKERPCLNYYIGRCIGPCLGSVSQADYRAVIDEICDFLAGKTKAIADRLQREMMAASERLDYETAGLLHHRLQALESLFQKQNIIDPERHDHYDAFGLARSESEICLEVLRVREGRMRAASAFFFPNEEESVAEVLQALIMQYYQSGNPPPAELLLPELPEDTELLASYLGELAGRKVRLSLPQRGAKAAILEMAARNAKQSLQRHTLLGGQPGSVSLTLERLGAALAIPAPRRIEAYDIANTGADDRSASMVVFEQGRPLRSAYRQFKIKSFEGIDDYAAMREVLGRRLQHLDDPSFGARPDLILLDGGKGHVAAVAPLLSDLAIPLGAMVKDDRHRTRGLVCPDGTILELRGEEEEDPEVRAERLALLRLLTAIQDEAHRFAGQLQKKLQKKRNLHYSLEDIPGVGPARRKKLYQALGSLKRIKEASLTELLAVPGIPESALRAVYKQLHGGEEA